MERKTETQNLGNLENRVKPYYKLKLKDLIPFYGILNYYSRTERIDTSKDKNEMKKRELGLYLYNASLVSGAMIYHALS